MISHFSHKGYKIEGGTSACLEVSLSLLKQLLEKTWPLEKESGTEQQELLLCAWEILDLVLPRILDSKVFIHLEIIIGTFSSGETQMV